MYRQCVDSLKGEKPFEINVAAAGLALLAGDSGPERKLETDLKQSGDGRAPLWLGQLGWWNYLGGNYSRAVDLLSGAAQQRPGVVNLTLQLTWAQIEIRRYAEALQTIELAAYESGVDPERGMARAVARWQAQEQDKALLDFNTALNGQPEWGNSSWVKALYSPLVAQSVQEMQAESERRKQKARIAIVR
jgi:hypothetical protein